MKFRVELFLLDSIVIGVLGGIWLIYSRSNTEASHVFPARIDRDCAPWDGPAFTISIPDHAVTSITISIWQEPILALPVTFSFPDETMRTGRAYLQREHGPMEPLVGKVWLQRLEQGKSVEGRFNLRTERGEHFNGIFHAEWGNLVVYCG